MPENKIHELWDELRTVLTGRNKILDSILPPFVFVIVNAMVGLQPAIWSALAAAGLFTIYRLVRRQSLGYALGGLGAVVLAVLVALVLNRAEGFFLPNILTGWADCAGLCGQHCCGSSYGGLDQLCGPALAAGLVLASQGASRVQRSDTGLGGLFWAAVGATIKCLSGTICGYGGCF